MRLIIVESRGKEDKLETYLSEIFHKDTRFRIEASIGHICDLPRKELGVDIQQGFEPSYRLTRDKKEVYRRLQSAVDHAQYLYLATDPDREGEAIAWHLVNMLTIPPHVRIYRTSFNALTKEAIETSFRNPQEIDQDLVNAQESRRILDRLVGYLVTPTMWQEMQQQPGETLSAGRVQSVGLRFVVDRQRKREKFTPAVYYQLKAVLSAAGQKTLTAQLVQWKGDPYDRSTFPDEEAVDTAIDELRDADFIVSNYNKTDEAKQPDAPFTTSSLQKAASSHLNISPSAVMQAAQTLYEGGFITYMRTDSPAVSPEAQEMARRHIQQALNDDYLPDTIPTYKARKGAQEAHECIRPTSLARQVDDMNLDNRTQRNLYLLIWRRFVASQMAAAVYRKIKIDIQAGDAIFRATARQQVFDGFESVYHFGDDEGDHRQKENEPETLPNLEEGRSLSVVDFLKTRKKTQPPRPYTEAKLVAALEKAGVGRPSTYAGIVETIKYRNYVKRSKKWLTPTPLGMRVIDFLTRYFDSLFDPAFTSRMETSLDAIAAGKLDEQAYLEQFWETFCLLLEPFGGPDAIQKPSRQGPGPKVVKACPACDGGRMVKRDGKYGAFLGCDRYPDCRHTEELSE